MMGSVRSNVVAGTALALAKLSGLTGIASMLCGHRTFAGTMLGAAGMCLVASVWLCIRTMYSREYREDTSWDTQSNDGS